MAKKKPLRQTISVPIGKSSISLEVTFRVIEIVERVYDYRADFVHLALQQERYIKRVDIAEVITSWAHLCDKTLDRDEIFETVITADDLTLRRYVGSIQAAIMYSLRQCTLEEMRALSEGKDIRDGDGSGDDEKKTTESLPGSESSSLHTES